MIITLDLIVICRLVTLFTGLTLIGFGVWGFLNKRDIWQNTILICLLELFGASLIIIGVMA